MTDSIIANKSFDFAIDIVNLYKRLSTSNKNYVLLNQLLRSGTSIGANVKEGLRGQSKKDFLAKMYIALKEADETEYWILFNCKNNKKANIKFKIDNGNINDKENYKK